MALIRADYVKETSNVTGTGAITLAGARSPGRTFASVCANGDTVRYSISNQSANEFEVGLGTYNSGPNTITRSPVASSNGGGLVNFSVGTKFVDLVVDTAQYNAFLTTAGAGGGVAISAAGQSASSGTITFSDANNVSFGMAGSVVTATATVDVAQLFSRVTFAGAFANSLSNAADVSITATRLHFYAGSTAQSSNVSQANVLFYFSGSSIAAAAYMFVVATTGGGFMQGISFANANAVTWDFSSSAQSHGAVGRIFAIVPRVRAAHLYAPGAAQFSSLSAATESTISGSSAVTLQFPQLSNDAGTNSSFSNANVFFRMSGSQSLLAIALHRFYAPGPANGVPTPQISFANANGVSWSVNSITLAGFGVIPQLSASVLPQLGLVSHVGGQSVSNVTLLAFEDASNVTFNLSTAAGAATVRASVAAGGGGGITALALSNAVSAVSATGITFSNANGFSFLMSTGAGAATISGSYTVPVVPAFAVSAAGASASSGTVVWSNSNNVSFGQAGSTITASVTVASTQGSINVSAGTTSQNISNVVFSNANGVTFGLNGSTVTASVAAAGGGATLSGLEPFQGALLVNNQYGQNSLVLHPVTVPAFQFDRFIHPIELSRANTNSAQGTQSLSVQLGFYTRSVSTLSRFASSSGTFSAVLSTGNGNSSSWSGIRIVSFAWTSTLPEGQYWIACLSSSATAGASATQFSIRNGMYSQSISNFSGYFGSTNGTATNNTVQFKLGQGYFSVTTAALPASIVLSQIFGAIAAGNSAANRPPAFFFQSGTG